MRSSCVGGLTSACPSIAPPPPAAAAACIPVATTDPTAAVAFGAVWRVLVRSQHSTLTLPASAAPIVRVGGVRFHAPGAVVVALPPGAPAAAAFPTFSVWT
jgi:hypothetical protein